MADDRQRDEDAAQLKRMGYAQQLLRDMGGFSNFAVSFSIISILTGAVTLYGQGLLNGGPLVMGLGWPLVSVMTMLVACGLAELASAYPTAGALPLVLHPGRQGLGLLHRLAQHPGPVLHHRRHRLRAGPVPGAHVRVGGGPAARAGDLRRRAGLARGAQPRGRPGGGAAERPARRRRSPARAAGP